MLVIRYEALIATPAAAFAPVIQWLGQDPPKDRLDRAIRFSAFNELSTQEKTNGFKERSAAILWSVLRHRPGRALAHGLSHAQQARIERDHGTTMQRFRYL